MSDSVRPHRQQPTSLPCPRDSPGKNTGVGCYFLLQCIKVKSESEVAQSCPTLSDPMDCSLPGSSVHGIFQARVLEWVAIAFFDYIHVTYILTEVSRDFWAVDTKKHLSYGRHDLNRYIYDYCNSHFFESLDCLIWCDINPCTFLWTEDLAMKRWMCQCWETVDRHSYTKDFTGKNKPACFT